MPDSLHGTLIGPLAERGHAIVVRAFDDQAATLPWQWLENRPGLRLTALLIDVCLDQQDRRRANDLMQWMLRINPHDNHGYRLVLFNELLRLERNDEALALMADYPGDMHPETAYGEVLVRLRTGDETRPAPRWCGRCSLTATCRNSCQETTCRRRSSCRMALRSAAGTRPGCTAKMRETCGSPRQARWSGSSAPPALRQEQPGLLDLSAGRRKRRRRDSGGSRQT